MKELSVNQKMLLIVLSLCRFTCFDRYGIYW